MREPAFWHRPAGAAAALLAPVACVYGAVAAQRMSQAGADAGVPVICVGNLTLGGAGKTPTAQAVGRILIEAGARPVFLSRGYGGRLAGPVQVDPAHHSAADVGDEPLLLASLAPAIVARDRVAGAHAARQAGADVIVMDDGFQNPALNKALSVIVVDDARGVGNGRVFPAGPLRAPLDVQLERVGAMLVIGEDDTPPALLASMAAHGRPVFRAHLVPDERAVARLRGAGPLLAFAGIGRPKKFFDTLARSGLDVAARVAFADHHPYRRNEALDLLERATREGLTLVTTEKDRARLLREPDLSALAAAAEVLPVAMALDDEPEFRAMILRAAGR